MRRWKRRFENTTITESVSLGTRHGFSRDPKDNKFLATATVAKAKFLITNDRDLLDISDEDKRKLIQDRHAKTIPGLLGESVVNVLVSGIGYSNLSDMSFGRVLLGDLAAMSWPDHVHVEDLNYGAIMIYQMLEASPVKYDRAVLVAAQKRGRPPGTLEKYHWDGALPSADEIQERIGEAVTGTISLETLLVVCQHFGVLPEDVTIVEIEPEKEDWGPEFSPVVAARVDEAIEMVRNEALRSD